MADPSLVQSLPGVVVDRPHLTTLRVVSGAEEHVEVIVDTDGSVRVPSAEVARLGARPGEHLAPVRGQLDQPVRRKRVRGCLVGRIPPDDQLTEEDFRVARDQRLRAAEARYGSTE